MQISDEFRKAIEGLIRDHKRALRINKIAYNALLTIVETSEEEVISDFALTKLEEIAPIMDESINDH